MTYIARRLTVTNEQGKEVEYSDTDFFVLNAPLIVLGEPGAGKSELVSQFAEGSGSRVYNASSIDTFPSIVMPTLPAKTIIDGVDEITAYEPGASISKILAKLANHEAPHFILTCRAVDWQDAVNTGIIQNRWQQRPVVGRILPLNHQEIVDFVNANGNGQNGEEFIEEAQKRDVVDLLKNPQNLTMLLKAVQNSGWPDTRLKLYDNATLALIQEDNATHDSINRTRPGPDRLIEAAGFIFAQLLLSGTTTVRVDGSGNAELPKSTDLAGSDLDESIIRCALSTKVFRVAGENGLEPCHRTIAEFLAAKWLTGALKDKLSLRRLESLLYGKGYIVPAALRGLHAWIATLCPALADRFIARDPYGFFRYGDSAVLTVPQSKKLLQCLEILAGVDPYFRSEDWHATFGRGLAKPELRDDIVRVIRNPSSPYQLSHLLIASIQGDSFVDDIADDLQALVLDPAVTLSERHASMEALLGCKAQPDWNQIVNQLSDSADIGSLRVALQIVGERITAFDGAAIANLLTGVAESMNSDDSPIYSGLGYGIHRKMSPEQLDSGLIVLSQYQANQERGAGGKPGDAAEWIFKFAQERLSKGTPPSATQILSWFQNTNRHSYHRSDWDKFGAEFFSQHVDLRQAIQVEALKNAADEKEYWDILFDFAHSNPPLWLRENDIIFHMDAVLAKKCQYADWYKRWRHLVRLAMMHRDFTGSALERANRQAEQHAELKEQLDELERPPVRDFDKEERQYQRKSREARRRKMQAIHKGFEGVQNELGAGSNLPDLADVAKAYLGRFYDIREGSTPIDRVMELVGNETAPFAFEGLAAVMRRNDIPTARQIVELHANDQKEFFFEPILIAHCAITLQLGQALSDIPLSIACSALAACHWGLSFGDELTSDLEKHLEQVVFADKESKETFVRDTMEPYLNTGATHISGLYRFARNEEFSDIAGSLAIEWLKKYTQLSNNSLRDLLIAAIRYAPGSELIVLIRARISNKQWADEEQRGIWIGAGFLLDYEHHLDLLNAYAAEEKERLWWLRAVAFPGGEKAEYWPKLSEAQNHFLITKFSSLWPPANHPSNGWSGDQNPWDASQFIQGRIGDLAANLSDTAEMLLRGLISASGLEGYQDYIKHVYAQQMRRRAEENKNLLPLSGVRSILLKGEPANHDDLQALLMDELEGLQDRIRNSPTHEILPFWNGDSPHDENYCRDRITSALTPYLDRYGVRAHTEGTMPNSNRCDLLNTHGMMNLPIEIKGQWHPDLWTAASEQLQNYTAEYRAEGRGIYLVLWFGYLVANHHKNPHGWQGQGLPKTIDEMWSLLSQRYEGISDKTKIFALDLSRHINL